MEKRKYYVQGWAEFWPDLDVGPVSEVVYAVDEKAALTEAFNAMQECVPMGGFVVRELKTDFDVKHPTCSKLCCSYGLHPEQCPDFGVCPYWKGSK